MNLSIVTLGTRGDLQPYLALGVGLQRAGHVVTIVSAKVDAEHARSLGLGYFPLDVDVQAIMAGDSGQAMTKGDSPLAFITGHLKGAKEMQRRMTAVQYEIWQACADADALIWHPGMANVYLMAQEHKVPSILASPFPMVATGEFPALLFYTGPSLGPWYNRLTHWVFERALWAMSRASAKAFWRATSPLRRVPTVPPTTLQVQSGALVLQGYSAQLYARPADWPSHVHVTGPWMLEHDPNYAPPVELTEFLAAGPPPVYVGFGSIRDVNSFDQTVAVVAEAVRQAGQRAVISLGWNQLSSGSRLPEQILLVGSVPHSWLFPRMAAVVHHGGAGTTAAGLSAGKPTVIIPHTADQPAWGRRVHELGVGPAPIPKRRLTAAALAEAIRYALRPDVTARAAELGQRIRQENGVQAAVDAIEAFLRSANRA